MRASNRRRGFALLMVLLVAIALFAIALPFAVSMRHQERGAKGGNDRAKARYAAEAARNHALGTLVPGHESLEEKSGAVAPFNTPFTDTMAELAPARTSVTLAPDLLASATVEDEQGKLCLATAPKSSIDRIKALADSRTSDLRRFYAPHSSRAAAWASARTIRGVSPHLAPDGSPALQFELDAIDEFGEGTRVRVTGAGLPAYGTVVLCRVKSIRIVVKGLAPGTVKIGDAIEAEVRHPVNVNTAPREVIAAAIEGLRLRGKDKTKIVTAPEAWALATEMAKQPFADERAFFNFLRLEVGKLVISDRSRKVIRLNSRNPNDAALAGSGTVPFCYCGADIYTIEARGEVSSEARTIAADSILREIVELAPSGTLRFRAKSQADFEFFRRLPTGHGIVTWPSIVDANEVLSADRTRDAWVTLKTGRDYRGHFRSNEHFGPHPWGIRVTGSGHDSEASKVLVISKTAIDIDAGAAECWVRPTGTQFTIFETGKAAWDNRIALQYGPDPVTGATGLLLIVTDSTLEHTASEVFFPVTLSADKWYHVGAFWKGTKFGHAMLTLDGLPVGVWRVTTEVNGLRHVTLAAAATIADTTIKTSGPLTGFLVPGVIEIGGEVIRYTGVSGNDFTGCARGIRASTAAAHAAGVGVTVFGYRNRLANRTFALPIPGSSGISMTWDKLTTGGGALVGAFAADTNTNVGTTKVPQGTAPAAPVGFKATDPVLSMPVADLANFPPKAWLIVGFPGAPTCEVIHYDSKSATQFTGLTRGLFGTLRSDHFTNEPVMLFGFHVTNNTNYLTPTILQLDGEWFGPLQQEGADGWRGLVLTIAGTTFPVPIRTATTWGTTATAHADATLVIPTFALESGRSGGGDVITLVEQDPTTREEHSLKHTHWVTAGTAFQMAALTSNVAKDWVPDGKWVRALKFPSGELPGVPGKVVHVGTSPVPAAPPPLSGWLDEIRLASSAKATITLSAALDSSSATVPPLAGATLSATGGAVLIGNEVIGYAGVDPVTGTPTGCVRGYLGTSPAFHDAGDRVFSLTFLGVQALTSSMNLKSRTLSVPSSGFQKLGYALVGSEIIGYTRRTPSRLSMPASANFRGAFGTVPALHNTGDLAYAFPFRYYDRYSPQSDDGRLYYFGASKKASGARWKRLTFEHRLPNNSVELRVLARVGSSPRFKVAPNNKPAAGGKGGVWLFTFPGGSLGDVIADELEARVYFVFKDGAYAKGEWKETPELHGLTLEYEQPTLVLEHEEK